jgi:putative phosphoesterase
VRIGIIADTHDNLPMVRHAVEAFAARSVEVIVHAGDFVAPFAARALLQGGIPVVGVFGNNDGERAGLRKACPSLHEAPHVFELEGRRLVLAHGRTTLTADVIEGADVVITGHTHAASVEGERPLFINPGEAGGWLSGRCSVAVLDLSTLSVEIVDIGTQETIA